MNNLARRYGIGFEPLGRTVYTETTTTARPDTRDAEITEITEIANLKAQVAALTLQLAEKRQSVTPVTPNGNASVTRTSNAERQARFKAKRRVTLVTGT